VDSRYTSVDILHSGCICLLFSSIFKCRLTVLVVLYVIFKLVLRNNFVMVHVSGPYYLKVAHFILCVSCEVLLGVVVYVFVFGVRSVVGIRCFTDNHDLSNNN
jgi:hypothetical protein